MELLFTFILFLQAAGLIPYMFYYVNDESNEWDKEDIKVVGIMQLPINIIMWIGSVVLYLFVKNPENLNKMQIFLQEPSGLVHEISYRNVEIIVLGYILALGIFALKSPQPKIGRLFLFLHMVSMSSFIVSILIFT